jgi:hypothetical protein
MINVERHQITLIHTNKSRPNLECHLEFGFIVYLYEYIETNFNRKRMKVRQLASIKRSRDQQHAVGSHDAGIENIAFCDSEILSQNGERACSSSCLQITHRTAKELFIGQDRKA